MKVDRKEIILLVSIALLFIFLRVANFSYPIDAGDFGRDRLVARHISNYKEFPLTGPTMGIIDGVLNNPVYYYFLSIVTLFDDKVTTFFAADIILQLASIIGLYFIAKMAFGKKTAVLALLLFSLAIVNMSFLYLGNIHQPWVARAFLIWGYLLLFSSYYKGKIKYLFASNILVALTPGLHPSSVAILPLYSALCIYVYHISNKSTSKSIIYALSLFILFFLPYILPILAYHKNGLIYLEKILEQVKLTPINSAGALRENVSIVFPELVNQLFFLPLLAKPIFSFVLLIIPLVLIGFYLDKPYQNKISLVLAVFILQPVIILSFVHSQSKEDLARYLSPVFPLFTILYSKFLTELSSKSKVLELLGLTTLTIFTALSLTLLNPSGVNAFNLITTNGFRVPQESNDMFFSLRKRLELLRLENGFDNYEFFILKAYYGPRHEYANVNSFYDFLEVDLGTKLTNVDNLDIENFKPLSTDPTFIILICDKARKNFLDKDCINALKEEYSFLKYDEFYKSTDLSFYSVRIK